MPQVLVQGEGNGSRHYMGKTELINLLNVAAIYNSSVVNPSIDQLSVGDYMEYEYIHQKKTREQVWHGNVVAVYRDRAPSSMENDRNESGGEENDGIGVEDMSKT